MQDIGSLGATRIVVGLSQLVKFTPPACFYGFVLKNVSSLAGGTLEIVPTALSGSSSAAGVGWGQGYPVAPNETISAGPGPAAFYLAATGVTQTVAVVMAFSPGATLL